MTSQWADNELRIKQNKSDCKQTKQIRPPTIDTTNCQLATWISDRSPAAAEALAKQKRRLTLQLYDLDLFAGKGRR
jgi:hypothetical protein